MELDRIRGFTLRRQLLGAPVQEPGAAIEGVVAVYSAQPMGPLSVAARVARFDPAAFVALERDRQVVRVPAMRSSTHLVPTATVGRVVAATARPLSQRMWMLKDVGISWEDYDRERRAAALAAAVAPATAAELARTLGWSSAQVRAVAQTACVEGAMLKVAAGPAGAAGAASLRSNAIGYVSTEAWLGGPLDRPDADGALAWLAGEYLRAFGPARSDDFAWWAGCGKRRAVQALGRVDTVEVGSGGSGLWLRAEDAAGFATTEPVPAGQVDVLPVWDAYTMGYPADGRARFGPPEVLDRLYDDAGNGLGMILAGGQAVGAWSSRFAGRTMEADIEELVPWTAPLRRRVEDRLGEIAELLDGTGLVVNEVAPGTARRPVGGKGNRRSYVPGDT